MRVGAGVAQNRAASERGMREAGTAELPRARRAWMGPPPAVLGLTSPRHFAAPIPSRCTQTGKAAATHASRAHGPGVARLGARKQPIPGRYSTTSRDGVAHEAPLSTVWRDPARLAMRAARRDPSPTGSGCSSGAITNVIGPQVRADPGLPARAVRAPRPDDRDRPLRPVFFSRCVEGDGNCA